MTAPVEVSNFQESPLRHLHDTRESIQKLRIQLSNRVWALQEGNDTSLDSVPPIYANLRDTVQGMEKQVDNHIQTELKKYQVYEVWLKHVKGLGPSLCGKLLSMLFPPNPAKGPSAWYKAAGIGPVMIDGQWKLPRARKPRCQKCGSTTFRKQNDLRLCTECKEALPTGAGRIDYHPGLRKCLWNVMTSFVKVGGYYRQQYDRIKLQLTERYHNDPSYPKYKIESTARWKTIRLFLAHLWEVWSETLNIPSRLPYVIEKLGHTGYIPAPRWDGEDKI